MFSILNFRRDIDTKPERADFKGKALKKEKTEELGAGASNYRGKDGALYTFEIFMRDGASARSRRDRAGKVDPRAPIVYNNAGLPNAIIPPNHKLMFVTLVGNGIWGFSPVSGLRTIQGEPTWD